MDSEEGIYSVPESAAPPTPDSGWTSPKQPVTSVNCRVRALIKNRPVVWPPLNKNAVSRLQDHQLPGDDFISLRFKAKANFRPLIFLPPILLAFLSDSAVLCYETKAILEDGKPACLWGKPAEDVFTKRSYCPAIAGFSPVYWSLGWYVFFLLMVGICHICGLYIRKQRKSIPSSPDPQSEEDLGPQSCVCYFLDCGRAGYTDQHLRMWFGCITLAFVNSICIRFVAAPEGDNHLNACIRYGDWTGHWDYCQPGVKPRNPVREREGGYTGKQKQHHGHILQAGQQATTKNTRSTTRTESVAHHVHTNFARCFHWAGPVVCESLILHNVGRF